MKFWLILLFVSVILVYGVFWPVLSFTLTWDDWPLYWTVINNDIPSIHGYWAHPGTMLEFLVLSKVLSPYSVVWMHIGLILKMFLAISAGKVLYALTKSQLAGTLGVIIVSLSYIGSQTVGLPSTHVALISGILLCLGLASWIEFIETGSRKTQILSFIFLIAALVMDLFRSLPVSALTMLLIPVYAGKNKKKSYASAVLLFVICLGLVILFSRLYQPIPLETELTRQIKAGITVTEAKVYVLNFFSSLGAIDINWLFRFAYGGGGRWINRILYSVGFFSCIVSLFLIRSGITQKNKKLFLIGFFIIWNAFFYIPHWIYEPRLIPDPAHKYTLIPGLGILMLLSYQLSSVRHPGVFLSICFLLFVNFITTAVTMNKGQFYRNTEIFQNAWNLVALGVPQNSKQVILYFSGSEPYYSYVFQNAGLFPYALNKKIRNLGEFPVAVHDRQSLLDALCEGNTHRGLIPDSLLSSVYAFDINDYGYVRNSTEDVHTELIREFKANNCSAPI